MIADVEEKHLIIITVQQRRTSQAITSLRVASTTSANVIAVQTVNVLTRNGSDLCHDSRTNCT